MTIYYIIRKIFKMLALGASVIMLVGTQAAVADTAKDVNYLYLNIGLQQDYPLPKKLKKYKLKFEGNYKRYTKAFYNKKTNSIRFHPKRQGSSVIIIKNTKNKILVRLNIDIQKINLQKIATELKELLISVDGIEIKIYNKQVIIDGQVSFPKDYARIIRVLTAYQKKNVRSLVTYSPEAQKFIAKTIEDAIGYPEVSIKYSYNRFRLDGCTNSAIEEKRAIRIAKFHTQFEVGSVINPEVGRKQVAVVTNNLSRCETEKKDIAKQNKKQIEKLIQVVIHFVEMNQSFSKGFFFQWAPTIGTGNSYVNVGQSGLTASLQATVSNFFPKLNWVKSFNFARVLHNSSLLIENESVGKISVETTVPQSSIKNGETVQSSSTSAQVTAEITPKIIGERDDLIKLTISLAVSSPASLGNGTNNKRIATIMHVRDGSSAVIGGMISSFLTRNHNNPKNNPPGAIVNLYSQRNYNTKKSQFVVFITPVIKSSAHLGVERIKKKFKLNE